jgi:hypothetical protein
MVRPAIAGAVLALAAAPVAAQDTVLEAASADGRWRIEAVHGVLNIVDRRDGRLVRTLRAESLDGQVASEVAALHAAPSRRAFVVSFRTLPEVWEISHDPDAAPIFDGLVHDYRMREGIALAGFLNPRRTQLTRPLHELGFSANQAWVLGREDVDAQGRAVLALVQLDVRRRVASFTLAGDPAPAAAWTRSCQGREVMVVPDRQGGAAVAIDFRAAALAPVTCASR